MGAIIQKKLIPIVEHKLEVGHFTFYPNIVVSEFAEGVHVTFENAAIPIQIATELYSHDKPLIYLSNRKNSYSMDPVSYQEVIEIFPNFKAFAIIATNPRRRMLANLEQLFIKRPIRVFDDLENALFWAEEFLKQTSKS